ncbi:MAG: hypothetical protein WBL93_03340 [Lutisporaceae bacterium]
MRKKYLTSIALAIMICIFCISYYRISIVSRNYDYYKEKEAIQLVSQYYENLLKENYKDALLLLNYDKLGYKNDLRQIKENTVDYKITYPTDTTRWVRNVYFDRKEKSYIVEATAQINYNTKSWIASEIIYIKNIDKELKIIKILTDDIYCNLRGSKVLFIGTNK